MIAFKILPKNYLEDWGEFESHAAGAASAPDGWIAASSPILSRDSSNKKYGDWGQMVVGSGALGGIYRTIPDGDDYAGRTFKLGLWALTARTGCYAEINDGVTSSTIPLDNSGAFVWQTSPGHKLDVDATQLRINLFASANSTVYFDSAVLCEGEELFTTLDTNIDPAAYQNNMSLRNDVYTIPQKEGVLIPENHLSSKAIRISGQIAGSDPVSTRTHSNEFLKALISANKNQKKNLYVFDDRVAEVIVDQIANQYVNPLNMMRYTINLINPKGNHRFINKYRNRQVISATVSEFSIDYNGSDESLPVVSFLANQGSTISTCLLKNLTTGESFSYTGTVPTGVALDIDCENASVYNSSVNKIADFSGDFLKLVRGTNYFQYSGTVCQINIDYYERFLSE